MYKEKMLYNIKLQVCVRKIKLKIKKLMLMLARKFTNYRLHMAGITQNKQKCLIFIVVPQGRKKF